MKKMTKTLATRNQKSGYGAIIHSSKGIGFLLIPYDRMVQIEGLTRDGSSSEFRTYANHSLPWAIVRRIVRNGTRGKIRDGWYYNASTDVLSIGCQIFLGNDLLALRRWALNQ